MIDGVLTSGQTEVQNLKQTSRRTWMRQTLFAAPVALLGGVVAESLWIGPYRVVVRRRQVVGFGSPIRWVQFSDVHYKGDDDYLHRVIERIKSLKPDFAVFTGDLIEQAHFLVPACDLLSQLDLPLYAIPGNHDHWSGADLTPFARVCRKTGGEWLQNRSVSDPSGRVQLIGIDHSQAPIERRNQQFNLVLVHYPAWSKRLGIQADLILAGHTHGGQVRIPFLGPVVLPHETGGYDLGAFNSPCGPLYVNPGIGTFHLNIRFRCPPEITVFES